MENLVLNIERIKDKNLPTVLASVSRISNEYIEGNNYSFENNPKGAVVKLAW
ncbi:hypothetical protein [Maribacter sp.]|uniref:hypothetical protein n=1 Tax=Maribacter sp. TaxID=1897614 RepID=UPI0025BFF65F|nr:hypothetical protein [Maribacter sp.]